MVCAFLNSVNAKWKTEYLILDLNLASIFRLVGGLSPWCRINSNHHHHYHQVVLTVQIFHLLSLHPSLLFIASGRSSRKNPVSAQSWSKKVFFVQPTLVRPCIGVHRRIWLMIWSLLLRKGPACLVCLSRFLSQEISGCTVVVSRDGTFGICLRMHAAFLCSSPRVFSLFVLFVSVWWIHTVVFRSRGSH